MSFVWKKTVVNSANSGTIAYSPTSAGDLSILVSGSSTGAGNGSIASVTDSNSNAWAQGVASFNIAGQNYFLGCYYRANSEASISSVTVAYNGGSTPGQCNLSISDYASVALSGPLTGTPATNGQNAPGTGANAITCGPTTPLVVPALVFMATYDALQNGGMSASGGGTQRYSDSNFLIQDTRAATSIGETLTGTTTHGSDILGSLIIAFAEPAVVAAGAGPTPRCIYIMP